jgi:hypothetical protein
MPGSCALGGWSWVEATSKCPIGQIDVAFGGGWLGAASCFGLGVLPRRPAGRRKGATQRREAERFLSVPGMSMNKTDNEEGN